MNGEPPVKPMRLGALIALIAAVVIVLWAGLRVWNNEQARNNPPVCVQLLGGHWSVWDGWQCGAGSAPASEPTCARPPPGDVYPIYPPGCIPPDTAAPAAPPSGLARHYGTYPGNLPMPHVNGATWWVTVDCLKQQCTTIPGAGPYGSTCGRPVSNEQVCAG
jgi:hypothetical protein